MTWSEVYNTVAILILKVFGVKFLVTFMNGFTAIFGDLFSVFDLSRSLVDNCD